MIPKRRAGDGWIDRTTSTAGLASSRGTRLLREAAFGTAALAMAAGTGRLGDRFRPRRLDQSRHPQMSAAPPRSTTRFGSGSARRSLADQLPLASRRRAQNFDAEFGHIESHVGRTDRVRSRAFSPSRPPRRPRSAIPLPRVRPVRGQSSVSEDRSGSRLRRTTAPCSRSSPIWCRCSFTLASLTPGGRAVQRAKGSVGARLRRSDRGLRHFRPASFTCRTAPSSRRTQGWAA